MCDQTASHLCFKCPEMTNGVSKQWRLLYIPMLSREAAVSCDGSRLDEKSFPARPPIGKKRVGGQMDAAETGVQGPHLHRVIPTDCEASAYPNKQLFMHSHSEGKCLGVLLFRCHLKKKKNIVVKKLFL